MLLLQDCHEKRSGKSALISCLVHKELKEDIEFWAGQKVQIASDNDE
jgi:hypothetical protein